MAHFSELDDKNNVLRVVVIHNEVTHDSNTGVEIEALGVEFCKGLYGVHTNWVQTSFNEKFRKNFGIPGTHYDVGRDAFITPKPFDSWLLDEDTCKWGPPIPYPTDGKLYYWDEETVSWKEVPAN